MQSLHLSKTEKLAPDLETEAGRVAAALAERRVELVRLQEEFHAFKARYTQIIGGRLAELAEIEREIRAAEARTLGIEHEAEDENDADEDVSASSPASVTVKAGLRKLFWSVARMFHPDHASDTEEAQRRHTIMAEASRAYREGDIDSLHTLLGDEQLQSFCAGTHDEPEDALSRLLRLKEDLRTVEFGIKRIRQDGLYQLKLRVDEEASQGRDTLTEQAEGIKRKIVKARRRLEHLS